MSSTFRHSFRVVISTKYIGPTNTKPSRIVATSGNGHRLAVPWDRALGTPENHANAAQKLANRLDWQGEWVGGGTDNGYVFVNLPAERPDPDSYYSKELARIPTGGLVKAKFFGENTDTKTINLNAESASAIRAFLAKLGF